MDAWVALVLIFCTPLGWIGLVVTGAVLVAVAEAVGGRR